MRSWAPVLAKIDLRWSWIVCSDSDILRAIVRVSLLPVLLCRRQRAQACASGLAG